MKLTPTKLPANAMHYKYGRVQVVINQFIKLDVECCHVNWRDCYANASSCTNALNASAKSLKQFNVRAIARDNECYLIRTDLIETKISEENER